MRALQQVLLFDAGTFEHLRYGGSTIYVDRKRTIAYPTPFTRTEGSAEDLPSPDALPHAILICFDLSRPAPIEVMVHIYFLHLFVLTCLCSSLSLLDSWMNSWSSALN